MTQGIESWVDLMGVEPVCEGALELDIAELLVGDVVAMFSEPGDGKRADGHAKCGTIAVANGTGAMKDLDRFPRWIEPLKRTGPLVPGEDCAGRSSDGGLQFEHVGTRRRHRGNARAMRWRAGCSCGWIYAGL